MNTNDELFFETIKCFEGEIYNLSYHHKRIARTIGKNIDLNEYIYPISDDLLKCKVIYSRDEIININYAKYIPKIPKKFKLIEDNDISYPLKSLQRSCLDKLYADKEEADEIIIIKNGFVTDTSIANIAIEKNNLWFTPKTPLLQGTTRERLIEQGYLQEYPITVDELLKTKKLALLNAMVGFMEIQEFEFIT